MKLNSSEFDSFSPDVQLEANLVADEIDFASFFALLAFGMTF